jgi:hypothetical protein
LLLLLLLLLLLEVLKDLQRRRAGVGWKGVGRGGDMGRGLVTNSCQAMLGFKQGREAQSAGDRQPVIQRCVSLYL